MVTKYEVGDKVLIEAKITKIHIDEEGVKYHVKIVTGANSSFTGLFTEDLVHKLDENSGESGD